MTPKKPPVSAEPGPTDPAPRNRSHSPETPKEGAFRFPLPFTGREEELAWLEERRLEAKSSLVAARLIGEQGMGKTRLLHEFLTSRVFDTAAKNYEGDDSLPGH